MKKDSYLKTVIFACLLALFGVGCGYGPDTSLPTDNVGPMLDKRTTLLTTWSPEAYRLVLRFDEVANEFWILDVEEPRLYSWTPTMTAIASVQGSNSAVFNHFELVKNDNNPRTNQLDIVGYLFSNEGKVALLPAVTLRGEGNLYQSDGPWFSPDGRWRLYYDSTFGLYRSGREIAVSNQERLELGSSSGFLDGGFARVLAWKPDSTAFIMTTNNEETYLINVAGEESLLAGSAGSMAFEKGQWLQDGRLILLKEERLYSYDLTTQSFEQLTGLGRINWFSFSPDLKYLATEEKVDCEYRADNDSWFPGNEYCNNDYFLYNENLEDRQRLTIFDVPQLHSPIWLPIEGIGPTWEIRSVASP